MGRRNIDAFWDRENLNNINSNFDELFRIVETVRDVSLELVNDGKLTEEQFQRLQIELNGLLKKGEVSIFDINKSLGKIDQTYLTEDLIQQIAGNADVNAIPANGSLTTNKYADKSVTPDKTDFIKVSSNLLNKHDVTKNKQLDVNTGKIIDLANVFIFNKWLEVKPGDVFSSKGLNTRCYYDKNKIFVSGNAGNGTFTIPENVYYMRNSTTNITNPQLNKGDALKPYEEYFEPYLVEDIEIKGLPNSSVGTEQIKNDSVTVDKLSFISRSNNLIDKNKISEGYAFDSSGSIVENAVHAISDYVKITPNQTYTSSTNSTRVIFYNENKEYISQFFSSDFTATFVTPSNAHYLRVNISKTRYEDAMLNIGDKILPYEDWYEPTMQGVKVDGVSEQNVDKEKINQFALDDHLNLDYTPPAITGIGLNDPITFEQIAYTDYYTYYDELMANNPDYISKTLAGTDKDGNEIYRYDFKPERPKYDKNSVEIEQDFDKPKIFLVSSTHGNERTVIWALYNTMKLICEQWQDSEALEFLRWNAHFIVIPIISPSGYRKFTRANSNGVDLNRNYTASWENGDSNPSLPTYRGPEPLSEPEAVICDNIMKNEDLTFVIDYHNFHVPAESSFNWIIGSSPFVNAIGEQMISKMARKWKKNNPDIPQDSRFFGHVSPMINVGNMSNQAVKEYGISSALFEVCRVFYDKPGTEKLDSFISTIATDSVINYLILIIKNANKL